MSEFEEMFLVPEKIKGHYEILDEFTMPRIFNDFYKELPNEYSFYRFLLYFPKNLYYALKPEERANIETCVLTGIENGELDHVTGYLTGDYSYEATWAVDYIEKFDSKEKIIEAIRQHALKSPLAQDYALWYFEEYSYLGNEENLNYYKNIFFNKKELGEIDYRFLRSCIADKRDSLYGIFRDLIERYEAVNNLPEENRMQDEMPF